MKRNIIKISIYIVIGFIVGFFIAKIPALESIKVSQEIPIFDIVTLLVTILLAYYVAHIIERDVQNSQLGKQMYLDRLHQNEEILTSLNDYVQEERILLSKINNLLHRYRSRQTSIHKALTEKSKQELFKPEIDVIANDTKDLKRLLTDTPIDTSDQSNITIRDGIVTYSKQRVIEITTCISRIDNMLFDLKHKINSSL